MKIKHFIGERQSGKSQEILKVFKKDSDDYDIKVIITTKITMSNDMKYDYEKDGNFINKEDYKLITNLNDSTLTSIKSMCLYFKNKYNKKPNILIIFDELLATNENKKNIIRIRDLINHVKESVVFDDSMIVAYSTPMKQIPILYYLNNYDTDDKLIYSFLDPKYLSPFKNKFFKKRNELVDNISKERLLCSLGCLFKI